MESASSKRVLVACECSGIVREAFNAISGVYAVSCDLKPCEDGRTDHHYQCDVRDLLDCEWDLMIAFPTCTYLSGSGMHWTTRGLRDRKLTADALEFVRLLLNAPIPRIALENPVGIISTAIRKPDQIIQPYQFGHDASKKTCLWLKNLPRLQPTKTITPRIVNGKPRWANQTDSGQNKLGPSEQRATDRSRTYSGVAEAMAEQWVNSVLEPREALLM